MDINNSRFLINGGKPLFGSVKVSGAKNSATKLLVASLLTDEPCEFSNSPNKINDLIITGELCDHLGSDLKMDGDKLFVQTPEMVTDSIPETYGSLNRIAILFAGPMLHRKGSAKIPIPGGCKIGSRPVNFHLEGLKQLGCHVEIKDNYYLLKSEGLKGCNVHLNYPSVGATENILIAATLAKGRTTITNSAVEPEILDLVKFLQKMGAIIEISTDRKITIEGVDKL